MSMSNRKGKGDEVSERVSSYFLSPIPPISYIIQLEKYIGSMVVCKRYEYGLCMYIST